MLYISASGLAANAGGGAVAVPADGFGGDGSIGVGAGRVHRFSTPSGGRVPDCLVTVYQCTPLHQVPVASMAHTPVSSTSACSLIVPPATKYRYKPRQFGHYTTQTWMTPGLSSRARSAAAVPRGPNERRQRPANHRLLLPAAPAGVFVLVPAGTSAAAGPITSRAALLRLGLALVPSSAQP